MISIVIPIHNEELLLESLVSGITSGLTDFSEPYEIILCENGSQDRTLDLAQRLAESDSHLVVLTSTQASYGAAIRRGILNSHGERIIVFNADLWDMDFLRDAYQLLARYDIVIASKRHHDSHDNRPFNRRLITWGFNFVLRLLFGFTGTDTHGMKAFRRATIAPIVRRCLTDREIFDTEVILRAQRAGLSMTELPTTVEETRPSRYSTFARVPRTLKDLWILYKDLHMTPQAQLDEVTK
ncbi:MAG: glycosyltransferase family 2 protein [Anaerolineae bacterium]|nr:glycosyltransferase family 2 protein [Anaerolineae bacterium]